MEGRTHGEIVLGGETLSGLTKPGETTETKLTAVYVLPLPVAIWIRERGLASLKEEVEVGNGFDLAVTKAGCYERRKVLQARP